MPTIKFYEVYQHDGLGGTCRVRLACLREQLEWRARGWQYEDHTGRKHPLVRRGSPRARVARVDRAIRRVERIMKHWTNRRKVRVSVQWHVRFSKWHRSPPFKSPEEARQTWPGVPNIVKVTLYRWEKISV